MGSKGDQARNWNHLQLCACLQRSYWPHEHHLGEPPHQGKTVLEKPLHLSPSDFGGTDYCLRLDLLVRCSLNDACNEVPTCW